MPIIAIIGIDGSGKTTQARLLTQRLTEAGLAARYIRPDYVLVELLSRLKLPLDRLLPSPRQRRAGPQSDSPIDQSKRNVTGLVMGIAGFFYVWMSYLVLAWYGLGGKTAVCDRYFYQFFYDLYGSRGSRRAARFFPRPGRAYFLDGSLELFRSRMTNPFDRKASSDYYAQVHSLLSEMASRYHFTTADAGQDASIISDFIFADCSRKLYGLGRSEA
ncbi:MAG: hypothetical protein HY671_06160 [Chloroflexi bacterium]|nr:hypothetical protein [Chloroflexota bacterium]